VTSGWVSRIARAYASVWSRPGIRLCSKVYSAVASASCGAKDRKDAGNGRLRSLATRRPNVPGVAGVAGASSVKPGVANADDHEIP
jgi:hypothetical protein